LERCRRRGKGGSWEIEMVIRPKREAEGTDKNIPLRPTWKN